MQYAVELLFDQTMEDKVAALVQKIADAGISTLMLESRTRPHITLACLNNADEAACMETLARFAETHTVQAACLGSVGMFTDTKTVFLSPTISAELLGLQRELHAALAGFDTTGGK